MALLLNRCRDMGKHVESFLRNFTLIFIYWWKIGHFTLLSQVMKMKAREENPKKSDSDPYRIEVYQNSRILNFIYKKRKIPLFLTCLILGALIFLPFEIGFSLFENAFSLPLPAEKNIGWIIDYTHWSHLAVNALILYAAFFVFRDISKMFSMLDNVIDKKKMPPSEYEKYIEEKKRFIRGEDNYRKYIIIPMIIGSLAAFYYAFIYQFFQRTTVIWHDGNYILGLITYTIELVAFLGIIAPLIMWRVFATISVMRDICDKKDDEGNSIFNLKPVSPDKAAGLKILGDISLKMSILGIVPMLMVIVGIWNLELTDAVIYTVPIYCIIIILLFFLPLSKAHSAMRNAKNEILGALSKEHNIIYEKFKKKLDKKGPTVDEISLRDMEGIDSLYQKATKMPVWPFDITIIRNFTVSILVPLILVFGKQIVALDYFSSEPEAADNIIFLIADAGEDKNIIINEQEIFNGNYSGNDAVRFEWDFDGNGIYDWQRNLTVEWPLDVDTIPRYQAKYTYEEIGRYIAVFKVTDVNGQFDTDTINVTVNEPLPK